MIKLGTNTTNLIGIDKVRLGSELVYQKGNPAPASTTLLMHLDGNLVNEVDKQLQMGIYTQIQGMFLYGARSSSTNAINKILYTYGLSGTDITSGNKSATISYWAKYISSSTNYYNAPTINLASFLSGSQSSSSLWGVDSSTRNLKFQSGVHPSNQIYHKSFASDFNFGEWHYYAFVANQGKIKAFVDGELYTECTTSMWPSTYFTIGQLNTTYDYDELFVCHEALYLQDFTPPTKPWDYNSLAESILFYSDIIPQSLSGGDNTANSEWIGANDVGEWKCSCSHATSSSHMTNLAFDNNNSTYAQSDTSSGAIIWKIDVPSNHKMNITSFEYKIFNAEASTTKLQGFNVDTQTWQDLYSQGSRADNRTEKTFSGNIGVPDYFSSFRLYVTRYASTEVNRLYYLKLKSGTIKDSR